MNRELMKTLLMIEVSALVKQGIPIRQAVDKAGKKLKRDMQEAEFHTYCAEHDC